jgi:ABC-2 type transport system permease protein
MNNLIKAEWFKLRKDRSFWTLIWILVAIALLYTADSIYDGDYKLDVLYANDMLSLNFQVMQLIPCILAGFFISGEYTVGTMKSIVSSGNSRMRVYLSKLSVFTIGAIILSVLLPIVMMLACGIYVGFADMPSGLFVFQTLGLTALYAAAFGSIMAVFSTMFTESGKSIGFLLLFFMFFDELLHVLSTRMSFLEPVWDYSVFKLLYDIADVKTLDNGQWFTLLLVPIVTFSVFALIGSRIFQSKEIK